MIYQTTMPTTISDRYLAHQFVVSAQGEVPCHWGFDDEGQIEIRSKVQIGRGSILIQSPITDARIRFRLDAHLRRTVGGHTKKKRRISTTDFNTSLDWIERQAPRIGLRLDDVDVESQAARIDKKPSPFMMPVSRFYGTAVISDGDLFEQCLLASVGDAKAFGFGFIVYTVEG